MSKYRRAGSDRNLAYDDTAFHLFLMALLAVYWVPTFVARLTRLVMRARRVSTPLHEARSATCGCQLCQTKAERLASASSGVRGFGFGDFFFLAVGLLLAFMSFKVYRANLVAETPFDPFSILEVSKTATKRQISKAYRRLSVIHHPDKNRGDPSAGDRFIKITKAFAALTDETAKENYVKYGNPDGYMGTSFGLGLPEWVAESHNTVLICYFIVMVVMFPSLVGIWWRRRSKQLNSSFLTSTFMLYRETLHQTTRFRDVMAAFAGSFEFASLFKSEYSDAIGEVVTALKKADKFDLRKTKCVVEPVEFQVHSLILLNAYLARLPIPDQLQPVLKGILANCETLLAALTDTVGAFQRPDCQAAWTKTYMHGHTVHLTTCIGLTQCVIQALDEKDSPLMQIPHFTDREVKYCKHSRSIYEFMRLNMEEQRKLLRSFTDQQFLDVKAFTDRYPLAQIELSDPIVEEEEDQTVHEGDTVTMRAKLTIFRRAGSVYSPHTPNLPGKKEEIWWVWLADQRLMCPLDVKRLTPKDARGHDPDRRRKPEEIEELKRLEEREDVRPGDANRLSKDPRVTIYDLKFTFMAPRAGSYVLEFVAAVDCYAGCDKSKEVKMRVAQAIEPPEDTETRYFDTDDESDFGEESSDEESDGDGEETDGDYEYIEVTDDEESADEDDLDDAIDISGTSGDPR